LFDDGHVLLQRFEYKYRITELQAALVRGFARSHLSVDRHAEPVRNGQYCVYSLYLDSPDLGLYHSSHCGEKNRFKLRVRYYDDGLDTPAFVEVKARRNDVIRKQRAPVRKGHVNRLLSSYCTSTDDLLGPSAAGVATLDRFCRFASVLLARPMVIVRYMREAYVDPSGGPLRLTMDRGIACLRTRAPAVTVDGPGWLDLWTPYVVLEIKFTDTFPNWARDMVEALSLERTSSAKYVQSVDALTRVGYSLS